MRGSARTVLPAAGTRASSDPGLRETPLPDALGLPGEWRIDPWLVLASAELAGRLGYA